MTEIDVNKENRRLGDPYAFALLLWPAVVGFMELSNEGWELVFRIVLGLWVVLLSLAVTFGRKGTGTKFGLAIILCDTLIAAFWWAHPGPWMYVWLFLLLTAFYAAQRARLDEPLNIEEVSAETPPTQRRG